MTKKKHDYFIGNGGAKIPKSKMNLKKYHEIKPKPEKKVKSRYAVSNIGLMCYEWD